ncbi:MAG: PD-(D/E)XK nuclease family protein [Bacteroides sp.]|nr:PD-(D/E)XK nuclease family protein [Bacteroides sp.]MCM1413484.1 PD-(D/E)XK nuclease family protein [Bacteroides sp.]MCM1471305.1 PD-(D/E)XK nuclease family protein [Bacteroides sp.]
MTPFLQQVAGIYAEKEAENLDRYCFVFPNKRSALFFTHYLHKELKDKAIFLPKVTNITDFITTFSDLKEANRYSQLFAIFDEYRKFPGVDADFDRFVFWGEMLMSDFNDVDRYMVDADMLFRNVKNLREISSNFLTDEQLELIRRFWGEERTRETIDRFWNHLEHEGNKRQYKKFVQLWEILDPLYHNYRERLKSLGLASQGMLYRHAAETLRDIDPEDLPYKRYIFVGFNILSTSEIKIFSALQRKQVADFYWDCNSPAMMLKDGRAGRFVRNNKREFASLYELPEETIKRWPEIEIIGVPSNTGQVKTAGSIIDSWYKQGLMADQNDGGEIDTAIVLPDEQLLIPMIHSVPESIREVNVTMGFPMKLSPMASLIKKIISLQLRSRLRNGERMFFHEDVASLLSSPTLRNSNPDGCKQIEATAQKKRLYNIPSSLIIKTVPELEPVFTSIADQNDPISIGEYVINLCDFLSRQVDKKNKMELRFIDSYREKAEELFESATDFNIRMKDSSFFKLVERAIGGDSVRFNGEPLKGLQIMGVLETRALDFKNIVMLSMNERIFPRRHYSRSFIPEALRYGYGMDTIDFQESIFAYYFYRMISRAERVVLLYDARRVGGIKSNELSRYPAQLLYLFNSNKIKHKVLTYGSAHFDSKKIELHKNDRIMAKLDEYREGGPKTFSASAINQYINCPLSFYLQYVEGYKTENEITDYVDSSTFGNIVHKVVQRLYQSFQNDNHDPVTITESMLTKWKKSKVALDNLIVEEINKQFNHLSDEELHTPLAGETLILGKLIRESILSMIEVDLKLCPFTFVKAEMREDSMPLRINDSLTINFKQYVDRVDRKGDTLRFIDYKTGGDLTEAKDVASMFDGNNDKRPKAILQLILYCHYHNLANNTDEKIMPLIYKMLTIKSTGYEVAPLKVDGVDLTDYHAVIDEFVNLLNKTIEEIYDPNVAFKQTKQEKNCTFCPFTTMCGRTIK